MNYKHIFFDLDGTLVDPKLGITKSVQYALNKFGIAENIDNLNHFIGPPLNKSYQEFYGFDEKKSMQAVKYYREYYIPKGMYECKIYNGIPELLKKLKTKNKKLYVVTSKPTFLAQKVIDHNNLNQFFEKIVGSKQDLSNADKTSLVKEALSINPHEEKKLFIIIGDREFDIIGAKANGIDSIGVTYGYGSQQEINDASPTHVVQSVEELEKYLI